MSNFLTQARGGAATMSSPFTQTQTRRTGRTPTERAPEPYSDPSWIHRIEELFDEREHADVVLAAPGDGRVFHLHRAILAGAAGRGGAEHRPLGSRSFRGPCSG